MKGKDIGPVSEKVPNILELRLHTVTLISQCHISLKQAHYRGHASMVDAPCIVCRKTDMTVTISTKSHKSVSRFINQQQVIFYR